MKYILLLTAFFFSFSCSVYKNAYKIKKNPKVEEYANSITAKELKQHLSVIASDEYEGRETGKKGQIMTAEYLKNEFKKDGIAPGNNGSYFQNFPLLETFIPDAKISLHGNKYEFSKDFYFFNSLINMKGFKVNTNEIIDLNYGIFDKNRDDYKSKSIQGKTVLISLDTLENYENWNWRKKLQIAKDKGVKTVLFTSKNFRSNLRRLDHFLNKSSLKLVPKKKKEEKGNTLFLFISEELKKDVITSIESGASLINQPNYNSFLLDYTNKNGIVNTSNVLGFVEGTDPELKKEIVILTAHYDHLGIKNGEVYNGADDDGTGTVALLELAEAFQKAKNDGNGPKRSILIMPVSGEEKGLLGSKYYSENPVFPISNTIVDLNIDMIGRLDENHTHPNYVYLIGADKISRELHEVSEAANKTYSNLELDYTFNEENDPNRFYYRSDHYNFAQKGIPVIFYFSGVHEDYHKATDEIDKIMFDKVEKITKLVFYTAWEVANKPARLIID
tara:strand:+ start:2721 stop:4229 length:1509 start_codon:yes stop_codon:yes gene_type:complete